MSVESKPFYWLGCDIPDCGESSPNGDEVSAYSDVETAELVAGESDWLVTKGKHFCPDHAFTVCRECGELLTGNEQGAGEYQCFRCSPELVETT